MRNDQFQLEGLYVDTLSIAEAAKRICQLIESGQSLSVFTMNLDHVVKLRRNSAFRRAYERARIILADGFPIALAGRLQGKRVGRATGSDLIEPLCEQASRAGLSVALLGSSFDSLSKAARHLRAAYPNLNIAGVYSPPQGFTVSPDAIGEAEEFVMRTHANIYFIALGAPKQEFFADKAVAYAESTAFVCIGAGLDFLAGHQHRAPLFVRRIGCEWAWRLAIDPRRLAARYFDCALVLPSVIGEALMRRRLVGRPG
jgi:exopolysaccharide biosynthesis WecB/TagA/CpsF family protein